MSHSVFISYRRDGGEGFAQMFSEKLARKRYRVFYDIEAIGVGLFDQKILREIEQADVFVVILSKGALDRCVNEGDWVRREIAYALELGKPIIPLFFRGFEFPNTLPKDIERLPYYNGVDIRDMNFLKAKFRQLCRMINEAAKQSAASAPAPAPAPSSAPKKASRPAPMPVPAKPPRVKWSNKAKKAQKYVDKANRCSGSFLFGKTKGFYRSRSAYYFLKAAETGNTEALIKISCIDSVPSVSAKLERAAKAGDARAQYLLGLCRARESYIEYRKDPGYSRVKLYSAIEQFRNAAVQGYIPAQFVLGNIYSEVNVHPGYNLYYSGQKDSRQAFYWYSQAAEQGVAYAQYRLGMLYLNAEGVREDHAKAVYHFRQAAEQGEAEAQYQLGECYRLGRGVDKDATQAAQWYLLAAERGHTIAQRMLVSLHG